MTRQWLELHGPDNRALLYLRALRKRRITGTALPAHGLRCHLRVDQDNLAAYRRLCHFIDDRWLPGTYPHVMAFPLHLQLLTAKDFPFPLLGLVHLHNRIEVSRPLGGIEALHFSVHAENLQAHAKGGTFDLVTEAEDGLGVVWRETSRMLVRGLDLHGGGQPETHSEPEALPELTRWYADTDIGRRYAKVCGDCNPIHLSTPSARLFGFPTAIAHGMWSKAMAMAAVQSHLPVDGYSVQVDFHKPVRLPCEIILAVQRTADGGRLRLDGHDGPLHMQGSWQVLGAAPDRPGPG